MRATDYLERIRMADHNQFGIEAESRAAKFLEEKNYKILKRNWRYLKAEIDIIAQDLNQNQIVIVEVKARKINPLVDPEIAVKKTKRKLLIKAADAFLTENEIDLETRFDIMSMYKSKSGWQIQHLENAFFAYE